MVWFGFCFGGGGRKGHKERDLFALTWACWLQLTSKRRVGISEFKGKYMVNIREYYEKDGEVLPGKKVWAFVLSLYFGLLILWHFFF